VVRDWGTERWDDRSAKEEDVIIIGRTDGERPVAFGFRAAQQRLVVTVDGLDLHLRLDAARLVELCEAFRQRV
jgi:hypothetical protein